MYKKIFQSEFNLGFKRPSADTCDSCDKFVLQLKQASQEEMKAAIKKDYDADARDQQKRKDKEESKLSPENIKTYRIVFLPHICPTIKVLLSEVVDLQSYCIIWDESVARKGGNEVASALLKWTEKVIVNSNIEELVIWSDNCPSQNRNIMMLVNYLVA
nr:unnamed protein product [Callosobruchus chinensis]